MTVLLVCGLIGVCAAPEPESTAPTESLRDIAEEAFIYAYPMMEQVKTVNGMLESYDVGWNEVHMNIRFPRENVGMPIVAPNLTSMTGAAFLDLTQGPVTLEVPEVKDRYLVYQCIDVFTHNFFYLGTRANGGEGGRFTFHMARQAPAEAEGTLVPVEGTLAFIVNRIDIKERSELERVHEIQNAIRLIDPPEPTIAYPTYDRAKAFSPDFVDYLNELLTEVPAGEESMFERFAKIGVFRDVELTDEQRAEIQAGIDAGFARIEAESANLEVGNGWFGATEVFGTREYLAGNYLGRATGAHFGLWGNSKEEANYFMLKTEGEGRLVFSADQLPPLTDIGFWSITVHDENVHVKPNEFDSYVLTMDAMTFDDDGSFELTISSQPIDGNWLYTPGGKLVILIRAYQADPERIGAYVPPPYQPLEKD
jgi:hypothetical protein